ncbi:MAG TPA: ABC transporter permease subunit [Acidimicrobiales bacterium]|nr:ABC transporter permease subunit [Acidimicrobiales bacterium]
MYISTLRMPGGRYGLRQVVRSELTKIASLRSTFWTLIVTAVGTVAVTILTTANVHHGPGPGFYRGFDATNSALTGLALATLAIGVFGILAATGEYGTGTIRSSLTATPRRRLFLVGKVLVVGAIALAVSEVLTFTCFWIGQAVLSAGGVSSATIGQPGVLRAVALSGAFLALLGLLALGLGVIIRHTAGAMAAYVGITFLIPLLIHNLPGTPVRYTPVGMLANSVSATVPQAGQVSAPEGLLLMALYTTVVLGLAAVLIARRDA